MDAQRKGIESNHIRTGGADQEVGVNAGARVGDNKEKAKVIAFRGDQDQGTVPAKIEGGHCLRVRDASQINGLQKNAGSRGVEMTERFVRHESDEGLGPTGKNGAGEEGDCDPGNHSHRQLRQMKTKIANRPQEKMQIGAGGTTATSAGGGPPST